MFLLVCLLVTERGMLKPTTRVLGFLYYSFLNLVVSALFMSRLYYQVFIELEFFCLSGGTDPFCYYKISPGIILLLTLKSASSGSRTVNQLSVG